LLPPSLSLPPSLPRSLSAACFTGPLVLQRHYHRKYVEPHTTREEKDEELGSKRADQEEEEGRRKKNYVESVYA
jgi:hypothetical protein